MNAAVTSSVELIKTLVVARDGIQKRRVGMGNQLADYYRRVVLGIHPGEKAPDEEELKKESLKILEILVKEFNQIMLLLLTAYGEKKNLEKGEIPNITPSQVMKVIAAWTIQTKDALITSSAQFNMCRAFFGLARQEEHLTAAIEEIVKTHPLWHAFGKHVPGLGAVSLGMLISKLDIYKAKYVSAFWAYCGLDEVLIYNEDTKEYTKTGIGMNRSHTVPKDYINKKGEKATKESLTYNPWIKTKLIGVIVPCLLKANSIYNVLCAEYKERVRTGGANHRINREEIPVGRYNMWLKSMGERYVAKALLKDLFIAWKNLEGLPCPGAWNEDKQGHETHYNAVIDVVGGQPGEKEFVALKDGKIHRRCIDLETLAEVRAGLIDSEEMKSTELNGYLNMYATRIETAEKVTEKKEAKAAKKATKAAEKPMSKDEKRSKRRALLEEASVL